MARLLRINTTEGERAIPITRVREITRVPESCAIFQEGVRTLICCGRDQRYHVFDGYMEVCRVFEGKSRFTSGAWVRPRQSGQGARRISGSSA